MGFFENIYNNLFPRSKLPKTPRPWRISLILEVVFGGWLFITEAVKEKFKVCKDIEYMTLLNLLDNYIPLVLTIYSTSFKLNNFFKYFNAMIRISVMPTLPLLAGDLRFFCLVSRSPALVHKSSAFYVHCKY